MIDVSRRVLLKGAGAVGASAVLGRSAAAQDAQGEENWQFFAREEGRFISAAVDRLIPPEPEWPGARAAGVPNFIDLQLAGPYGAGDRLFLAGPIKPGLPTQGYQLGLTPAQLYRQALEKILAGFGGSGLDFAGGSPADQDEALTRLERGELDLGGFPSSIFFETLLSNTIEGYFGDPAYGGNRDMTAWKMIGFPGPHAAYLGIYTQHGLAYDQPPHAMAVPHSHP